MKKHDQDEDFHAEHEPPSKSELKRRAHELQELGEFLLTLKPEQLARVPLTDPLAIAIERAERIPKRSEAMRRHYQYIGKLMRDADCDAIRDAVNAIKAEETLNTRHLHELEQLRDKLIHDGFAGVDTLLGEYPQLDRQKLRQLVKSAQKERADNSGSTASRQLFRYLRDNTDFEGAPTDDEGEDT
ncbi:MAG TPA: ribosome biogenesis factor YjgA [Pseudomonadales bacterium]|nr:ribosome biogenesis factor YjgA [Pseudomonadales bacterium]